MSLLDSLISAIFMRQLSRDLLVNTPCPRKKQATLIFAITSPSVEIFLQFLKHFAQE